MRRVVCRFDAPTWPEDHPNVLNNRKNLAVLLGLTGEPEMAARHLEEILAIQSRSLPSEHPTLLTTRGSLAVNRLQRGLIDEARAELEALLESFENTLAPEHPDLLPARTHLARAKLLTGEAEGALELIETNLAIVRERDPVERSRQRRLQLAAVAHAGSPERTHEVALQTVRDARALLDVPASPREQDAMAVEADQALAAVAMLEGPRPAELEEELFLTSELLRGRDLQQVAMRRWIQDDREARSLTEKIAQAGIEVVRLTRSGATGSELFEAISARDRLQRELRERVAGNSSLDSLQDVALSGIRDALGADEAAVAFRRYGTSEQAPETAAAYVAWVVRRDRPLARVELGDAATIEAEIEAWRARTMPESAFGRGLTRRAPVPPVSAPDRLGMLVFGPLVGRFEGADRVHLSLAGPLHSIPWEAVELEGQLLGDRFAFVVQNSLLGLTRELDSRPTESRLLVVGGVEYAEPEGAENEGQRTRGGSLTFAPLPGTLAEIDVICETFAAQFGEGATVARLEGGAALRSRFLEEAPQARFVHLATHGWFAPESIPSLDSAGVQPAHVIASSTFRDRVIGLAPATLCGLAFAAATGEVAFSDVVLTAEELALLDLSRCELAVLSACETNVGFERGGQGIASLQAALHVAGARSAVTSLWRVPDEATRVLMSEFYRRMWVLGEGKAEALRSAKRTMREEVGTDGRPRWTLGDWAGWVFSGCAD